MKILKLEIDKKLAGKSLEKILRENLGLSRREVSRAKFQPKGICIDGKRQRITYRPSVGQNLEVCLAEMQEEKSRVKPCAGKLEILYEDRDLLVVEKPGGIPCHPGRGHYCFYCPYARRQAENADSPTGQNGLHQIRSAERKRELYAGKVQDIYGEDTPDQGAYGWDRTSSFGRCALRGRSKSGI